MFDSYSWIVQNQLSLTVLAAAIGIFVSYFLWKNGDPHSWKVADLVWVLVGGLSAISAVVATIHLSKLEALSKRVSSIASVAYDVAHETDVFAEKYCSAEEQAFIVWNDQISLICRSNSKIAAAIRKNSSLPLFSEVMAMLRDERMDVFDEILLVGLRVSVLQQEGWSSLDIPDKDGWRETLKRMKVSGSNPLIAPPSQVRLFDPLDDETSAALDVLGRQGLFSSLVAEYRSMGKRFRSISESMVSANDDWLQLQNSIVLVATRVMAIALLVLVFPIRVAKSMNDLRRPRNI